MPETYLFRLIVWPIHTDGRCERISVAIGLATNR